MKIFDKRPLSLILCILLCGFVFFTISNYIVKITIVVLGILILIFGLFLYPKEFKNRILTVICAAVLLLSCLLSFLYFNLYFYVYMDYIDDVEIYGTVTDIETFSGSKILSVKTESINATTYRHLIRVHLTLDESENISEGSKIRIIGTLTDFKNQNDFNAKSYYNSHGYTAEIEEVTEVEFIENGDVSFSSKIGNFRNTICRRIILYSDNKSGGLLCALLLGERDYLSKETELYFSRTGLSHLLALSGLHLAILSFALGKLLVKLKIAKKQRKIFEIIFTIIYMSLTGFPVSVVRAGLMLIISSLLFLLARNNDSITTLFIAITLIVILEPYSIFDISLWLSAFATVGILVLNEIKSSYKESNKTLFRNKIIRAILFPIAISLFALSGTFLLSATSFGGISIIAPIATPIFSILVEVYMYIGMIFTLLGPFLSLGNIIKPFGSFIIDFAGEISSISGIYTSAEFVVVEVMVYVFTITFIAFALLDIKKKRTALIALSTLLLSIFISSVAASTYSQSNTLFQYLRDESNERFVMQSDGKCTVIDITTPSASSSDISAEYIKSLGLTEIERYIFTDYSARIQKSAETINSSLLIRKIYIPMPTNENELVLMEELKNTFEGSRTTLIFYPQNEFIKCEDFDLFPKFRSQSGERKLAFTIHYNGNFYTYLSSGMLEDDTKSVALSLINGAHTLILGRHGNSYSNYNFIYKANGIERIVFSSKNMIVPGETLYHYRQAEIYYSPEKIDLIR